MEICSKGKKMTKKEFKRCLWYSTLRDLIILSTWRSNNYFLVIKNENNSIFWTETENS